MYYRWLCIVFNKLTCVIYWCSKLNRSGLYSNIFVCWGLKRRNYWHEAFLYSNSLMFWRAAVFSHGYNALWASFTKHQRNKFLFGLKCIMQVVPFNSMNMFFFACDSVSYDYDYCVNTFTPAASYLSHHVDECVSAWCPVWSYLIDNDYFSLLK